MAKLVFKETNLNDAIKDYDTATRHRVMIFSQALIILLLYEILLAIAGTPRVVSYDGADLWFKLLNTFFQYGTTTFSVLIGLYLFYFIYVDWMGIKTPKERKIDKELRDIKKDFKPLPKFRYRPNWYYFGFQVVEGFVYGTLIYLLLQVLLWLTLVLPEEGFDVPIPMDTVRSLLWYHTNPLQDLALAFGAGFYEEVIFRYLIFWFLLTLAGRYKFLANLNAKATPVDHLPGLIPAYNPRNTAFISAIIWGSIFYSITHYVYYFGDIFSIYSFFYRLCFGVILYIIFARRHLGIAMWTHVVHDLWYFLLR